MSIGGKRKGSGRPKGTSRYKEDTKPIRIPLTLVPYINKFLNDHVEKLDKKFYKEYVCGKKYDLIFIFNNDSII